MTAEHMTQFVLIQVPMDTFSEWPREETLYDSVCN
jgi:hypothetical protein